MAKYNTKGQSLIEVIIGMAIATILIGAAAATTVVVLRSNFDTKTAQIASFWLQNILTTFNRSLIPTGKNLHSAGGQRNRFAILS